MLYSQLIHCKMNNKSLSRRKVLKGITAASTGAVLASSIPTAAASSQEPELVNDQFVFDRSKLSVLRSKDALLPTDSNESHINDRNGSSDRFDIPNEVKTGQRLLELLSDDGLIDQPSLEALPDTGYEIRYSSHTEIGFIVETERGEVQITFSKVSSPFAVHRTDDKDIEYNYTKNHEYTRSNIGLQSTISNSEGVGTMSSCDECWCRTGFCPWCLELTRCVNYYNGRCWTTDKCCC